jgi:GTPase SAR1 family protein
MAGIAYPWRLEQTHAMLIGTTGAGKTTQLRKLVTEARERGQRCVVFDLTGAFVEAFYEEGRDHILNPMDQRCPPGPSSTTARTTPITSRRPPP